MRPRAVRTEVCGRREAATRLAHARKFLEVAELVASETDVGESASVSASLAVLAGIAASDAVCCASLGRRARGQDHRQATDLLAEIEPQGAELARALGRLLDLKDTAQYGMISIGAQRLTTALRQARRLVDFAGETVSG